MEIKKIDGGFAIRFPFPLKDAFRVAFPSAKWNADEKQWQVGPRSGKRLEAWVAEAAAAAEEIVASEEAELAGAELARVRAAIAAARANKLSADAYRAELAQTRAQLEAASAELEQAAAAAQVAREAVDGEKAAIAARLGAVVNLDMIRAQARVMAANMVPADRQKKERFEEARGKVRAERDKLRAAGFACAAIGKLASANVNRPDRDHPRNVLEADWFNVWAVESDD